MNLVLLNLAGALILFIAMVACAELGRRIGLARQHDGARGGPAEAAVLALLGLLIAFSFSGAASRFEDRRHLVGTEAEMIGTAFLRVDMLPEEKREPLRELFRRYLDARIVVYQHAVDAAGTAARLAAAEALQKQIWDRSVQECGMTGTTAACMLMLPAINQMIDITTTRVTATRNHPPAVLFGLLAVLSLVGAMLVGHGSAQAGRRTWLQPLVFAGALSVTIFVIVDLEFPRAGFIRVDGADRILVELRRSFGP